MYGKPEEVHVCKIVVLKNNKSIMLVKSIRKNGRNIFNARFILRYAK